MKNVTERLGHAHQRLERLSSNVRLLVLWAAAVIGMQPLSAQPAPAEAVGVPISPPWGPHEAEIEQSVQIPMQDGIHLSTDIYRPRGITGKLPVILIRTPYRLRSYRSAKPGSMGWYETRFFVSHGYAVAVQDIRGQGESGGEFFLNRTETQDSRATLEWLGTRPWSNGRIGMTGCSYPGHIAYFGGASGSPYLKAIIPRAGAGAAGTTAGLYNYWGFRFGGTINLWLVKWMIARGHRFHPVLPAAMPVAERPAALARMTTDFDMPYDRGFFAADDTIYWTLPVKGMVERGGGLPGAFDSYASMAMDDPAWTRDHDYLSDQKPIDVPALHVNAWFDEARDTLALRAHYEKHAPSRLARENQFAIISPTTHCDSEEVSSRTIVGPWDAGDARFDYWTLYRRWFDRWLKDERNGVEAQPKVRFYSLGDNNWRSAPDWPLAGTREIRFFLGSGGRANSHFGDGTLGPTVRPRDSSDAQIADPGSPVWSSWSHPNDMPHEQRMISARHDVLVYTSDAATSALRFAGPIRATLHLSSTAPDTDFLIRLVDVDPSGAARPIKENIVRMRYRDGYSNVRLMEPGNIYKVEVDLFASAFTLQCGHRLRLQIAPGEFPAFSRNLNTGGDNFTETSWRIAENRVHHGAGSPSHVRLQLAEPSRPCDA